VNLHSAGHRRGVCCAPHHLAVEAGRAILAEGGNAIEAMVAMAATIAVVYPHMNGIGGDGFWLIRERSGRIRVLMAAGAAGAKADAKLYRNAGHDVIPARGPLAALTVPGAIAGWMAALEAAKALGGKRPVGELMAAAIGHAKDGVVPARSFARCTGQVGDELKSIPDFAATFLADGRPPPADTPFRQPPLAETLEQLAHAGLDDFYRGDIAREIAADLDRLGSPVTRRDLEGCRASVAEPLALTLAEGTLYNTPPPTQGLASLMILGMFERLGVKEPDGFDHMHGLVESTKRALRLRDGYITDPGHLAHPPDRYLESSYLDREAAAIDRRRAASWHTQATGGDTIWMGAADGSGLIVSYIQSLYWEFGSAVVLPSTGVLMQNRGLSFSLDPRAVNMLAPGRVPRHTLNPALAVLRDGRVMAYGTMGGDAQPQIQATLFTRHIMYRQPLDVALDSPRFLAGRTWGSPKSDLYVESRLDGNVIDRLLSAGHEVTPLGTPYADVMGHAGAVVMHSNGNLEAAHDPRADGGAAGV